MTSFNNLINFHKKLFKTLNFLLYMRTKEDAGLKLANNQGCRSGISLGESGKKIPNRFNILFLLIIIGGASFHFLHC